MINDAHNMKAVGNDPGIGKEAADDVAVGTGKIDTDDLHLVSPTQGEQIRAQIRDTATRSDIENAVVAQIAKSGAEALSLVQGVFINTEVLGAVQRESLIGFATGELGVDTAHRSGSETLVAGNGARTYAVMMVFENLLPERLRTMAPLDDAGKFGQEATQAASALESPGVDVQDTGSPEGFQVTGLTQVTPLAADAGAKAVRTAFGFKG